MQISPCCFTIKKVLALPVQAGPQKTVIDPSAEAPMRRPATLGIASATAAPSILPGNGRQGMGEAGDQFTAQDDQVRIVLAVA